MGKCKSPSSLQLLRSSSEAMPPFRTLSVQLPHVDKNRTCLARPKAAIGRRNRNRKALHVDQVLIFRQEENFLVAELKVRNTSNSIMAFRVIAFPPWRYSKGLMDWIPGNSFSTVCIKSELTCHDPDLKSLIADKITVEGGRFCTQRFLLAPRGLKEFFKVSPKSCLESHNVRSLFVCRLPEGFVNTDLETVDAVETDPEEIEPIFDLEQWIVKYLAENASSQELSVNPIESESAFDIEKFVHQYFRDHPSDEQLIFDATRCKPSLEMEKIVEKYLVELARSKETNAGRTQPEPCTILPETFSTGSTGFSISLDKNESHGSKMPIVGATASTVEPSAEEHFPRKPVHSETSIIEIVSPRVRARVIETPTIEGGGPSVAGRAKSIESPWSEEAMLDVEEMGFILNLSMRLNSVQQQFDDLPPILRWVINILVSCFLVLLFAYIFQPSCTPHPDPCRR